MSHWQGKDVRAIYQAYPRHTGSRAALAAIERALTRLAHGGNKKPVECLLRCTHKYAASPAGNQGEFTPHPATWFNQGRYEDDPAEWQKAKDCKQIVETDPVCNVVSGLWPNWQLNAERRRFLSETFAKFAEKDVIQACRNFYRDNPGTVKSLAWPEWNAIRTRVFEHGMDCLKALHHQHARLLPSNEELQESVLGNRPTELERELGIKKRRSDNE